MVHIIGTQTHAVAEPTPTRLAREEQAWVLRCIAYQLAHFEVNTGKSNQACYVPRESFIEHNTLDCFSTSFTISYILIKIFLLYIQYRISHSRNKTSAPLTNVAYAAPKSWS